MKKEFLLSIAVSTLLFACENKKASNKLDKKPFVVLDFPITEKTSVNEIIIDATDSILYKYLEDLSNWDKWFSPIYKNQYGKGTFTKYHARDIFSEITYTKNESLADTVIQNELIGRQVNTGLDYKLTKKLDTFVKNHELCFRLFKENDTSTKLIVYVYSDYDNSKNYWDSIIAESLIRLKGEL